jgi:hypothetical protein
MRELIFLVGRSSVVGNFVYTFGAPPTAKDHVVPNLPAAGISYVVGYALQDVHGLLSFLPTATPQNLNRYQRRFYEWYTRELWQNIPKTTDF